MFYPHNQNNFEFDEEIKVLKSFFFIENKWKFRMCGAKSKEKLILKLVKAERLGKLLNIKIYLFIYTFYLLAYLFIIYFLNFVCPPFLIFRYGVDPKLTNFAIAEQSAADEAR